VEQGLAVATAFLAVALAAIAHALGRGRNLAKAEDWVRPPNAPDTHRERRGLGQRVGSLLPVTDHTAAVITAGLESVGWTWTVAEWQALHLASALCGALAGAAIAWGALHSVVFAGIALVVGGLLGWPVPDSAWLLAMRRRRARVDAEILPFLDVLGMLCGAGLGFEAAVVRACAEMPGVLAEEFRRLLVAREHHALSTRPALKALAERVEHPEVRHLAEVVTDGLEAGRGLAEALAAAAADLRAERLQAIERRAQGQAMSSSVLLVLAALLPTALMILYPSFRLMTKAF